MSTYIWRNHSSFMSAGYMWVVLNQANILKRHTGVNTPIYWRPRRDSNFVRTSTPQPFDPKEWTPSDHRGWDAGSLPGDRSYANDLTRCPTIAHE